MKMEQEREYTQQNLREINQLMQNLNYSSSHTRLCTAQVFDSQSRHAEDKTLCMMFNRNIRFLLKANLAKYKRLHDIINAIHAMIPSEITTRPSRVKTRALLPFLGDLAKSIMGVATSEDVKHLQETVLQVAKTVNTELNVFKKSTLDMSSFVSKTNTQIETLIKNVKEVSMENLILIANASESWDARLEYLNNLTLHTADWIFHANLLMNQYEAFFMGIQALTAGHLTPNVIDESTLKAGLTHVLFEIQKISQTLTLAHAVPNFFYKHGTFIYKAVENTLYITLQVPITTVRENFDLFEIKTFSLPIAGQNHVTKPENLPFAVAIASDRDTYLVLNEVEAENIMENHHSIVHKIFYFAKFETCMSALIENSLGRIEGNCHYSVQPSKTISEIHHLTENAFLLINVTSYTLKCGRTTTQKQGCLTCIINVPKKCEVTEGSHFIPLQMTDSNQTVEGHILNLPVANKFFSREELSFDLGSPLGEPPDIALPKFKFFEHNMTKKFANMDVQTLDLRKAAEAVKTDSVIVGSLSEAVVLGDFEAPQSFWFSYPGIAVMGTGSGVIGLAALVVLLSIKVRKLTITVALLQQVTMAKTQLVLKYGNTEKIVEEVNQNVTAEAGEPFHKLLIEISNKTGPLAVTIVVIVAILGFILYTWCKKRCNKNAMHTKLDLMMEVLAEQGSLCIFLKRFRGQPSDYKITADAQISQVQVKGLIFPTITFFWKNVQIFDKITRKTVKIKSSYRISMLTAIKLRGMLKRECVAKPVWRKEKWEMLRIECGNFTEMQEETVQRRAEVYPMHEFSQSTMSLITGEATNRSQQPAHLYPILKIVQ